MQDLTADATDNASFQQSGADKRATWYGPPSTTSSTTNFDPDEDMAILQRQYNHASSIPEEDFSDQRMQRSSSDM